LQPAYKNPAPGKALSHARIGLNAQFHLKKSMFTAKLALVIWIDMDLF
jgi:hypothetical protein